MSFDPNNPPVNPEYYQPSNFVISDIVISSPTQILVTTSIPNNYVYQQQVRLHIPRPYGMYQLNDQSLLISSIVSSTEFLCDTPTTNLDPFIASPAVPGKTLPQVSAIGDQNNISAGLSILGAFINISQDD